ncbi:restriction endonuclease [Cytobacillus sp. Bac17]|uniref:restriction endonuclease n=1 Tax=Cytobacillus sp. Bac17 TaxID=2926008 RepID=UPI0021173007|nr:restriction endonuclease [Cytobacillus sp. Bac17]
MGKIKKYINYETTTKCSVPGCTNNAEYEVYLYDYYDSIDEEFFEQDYTCPFICNKHMNVNEANARGEKRPRGSVHYPFTNKNLARGYTRYHPVLEVYFEVINEGLPVNNSSLRVDFTDINTELIKYLSENPELMQKIDPRKFEELVAELFNRKGYDVSLTQRTRDGGKDIYAIKNDSIASTLFVIETKRYSKTNKVGVEIVRSLYGVKTAERANVGMIVTTSSFTKAAIDFASPLNYELSLRDFENLKEWLKEYK